MQEIVIDFDEQGNATIEGKGFVGTECTKLTKAIEEALGTIEERTLKADYRRTVAVHKKVGA